MQQTNQQCIGYANSQCHNCNCKACAITQKPADRQPNLPRCLMLTNRARPSSPISRVLLRRLGSKPPHLHQRSSIWDWHCCPPHAAYPGLKRAGPARRPCLALLRVGVAWPRPLLRAPVRSYRTVSPSPMLPPAMHFSVALFPRSPGPYVIRHAALWSADFPQARKRTRDRPAYLDASAMVLPFALEYKPHASAESAVR